MSSIDVMGGFWSSSQPNISTTQAPDRSQRQVCWDARDAYFACLDRTNVLTPGQEQDGACTNEKKTYHGSFAQSWVRHCVEIQGRFSDNHSMISRSSILTKGACYKRSKRNSSPSPRRKVMPPPMQRASDAKVLIDDPYPCRVGCATQLGLYRH